MPQKPGTYESIFDNILPLGHTLRQALPCNARALKIAVAVVRVKPHQKLCLTASASLSAKLCLRRDFACSTLLKNIFNHVDTKSFPQGICYEVQGSEKVKLEKNTTKNLILTLHLDRAFL
ncbi:MAG: hypothetical protein PUP91_07570 [Rhizonema sp. PD37]|nr:hypothetical protein [Rhizonema sp. PD37]